MCTKATMLQVDCLITARIMDVKIVTEREL